MTASAPFETLRDGYASEARGVEQSLAATGDGMAALAARTALADRVVALLHEHFLTGRAENRERHCLVALGGYGRKSLFPRSDIDLLFLFGSNSAAQTAKEPCAALARHLWDVGMRASATSRTLEECDAFEQDNPEFAISLLDCRLLAGDAALFARLRDDVLPHLVAREQNAILGALLEMTRERHAKYGNTIFHLEPNIKDAPGGLRDFDVACWVTALRELAHHRRWTAPESGWAALLGEQAAGAFRFLADTRCFLHLRNARDDNRLTYEFQDEAASRGIGLSPGASIPAEEWMRSYFRHARAVQRLAARLLDQASGSRSSLYGAFEDWRARLSNDDFSVLRGRVFCRRPAALAEPAMLLGLFEFVARHGLELSVDADSAVERALESHNPAKGWPGGDPWPQLSRILALPHAGTALRAMHRLGVLDAVLPEFQAIDCLVVRDLYHRYTVDEHTFLAIEALHALRQAKTDPERRYAEILAELDQPEVLFLAILFHDVGKGMPGEDHIRGSLDAVEHASARLALAPADKELVCFLILHHLEMSATLQRRDIFDAGTIRSFAEIAETPERLRMLCLLTYADVKSVNPEALTQWKAEMLWQLYAATANHFTRGMDRQRLAGASERDMLEVIRGSPKLASTARQLAGFLDGFPRRYLKTHTPEEITDHLTMAQRLVESLDKSGDPLLAEVLLRNRGHVHELTVVTRDRPRLFATLTGTLTGWGMNIVKADAFSNSAGIVLDSFRFSDPFRTLELNASESERFLSSVREILDGKATLDSLLKGRMRRAAAPRQQRVITTEIRFDDESSAHSTVLEVVTRDRPGLLYGISSVLAETGCNLEVALVDTQGEKAIDVFYLTTGGNKLDKARQSALLQALLRKLDEI
jgi:[protein-PII] uridylyltransferase